MLPETYALRPETAVYCELQCLTVHTNFYVFIEMSGLLIKNKDFNILLLSILEHTGIKLVYH